MYVLQHPQSKDILAVRNEVIGIGEDSYNGVFLVNFNLSDHETFMFIKDRKTIQRIYDVIQEMYGNEKDVRGMHVSEFICDIKNINEYKVVGYVDAITNFNKKRKK